LRFFINNSFPVAFFLPFIAVLSFFLPLFSILNTSDDGRILFCALFFGLFFAFLLTVEMFIIGLS